MLFFIAVIQGATAAEFTAVSAGDHHTVALAKNGTVWAWGLNDHGQLGIGTTNNQSKPVASKGLKEIVAIASGANHTLALRKDGTVWACGQSLSGDLTSPASVKDLKDISAIAAGCSHSAALRKDGTVWTWGGNHRGQLGDGSTTDRDAPVPVKDLKDITAISAGSYQTFALRNAGTVWAWGANRDGRLGDGTTENRATPVQVVGLSNVTAIAAGGYHTLALMKDGTVRSWGSNWSETWQLGDSTTMKSLTPVVVTGLTNVPASGEAVIPLKDPFVSLMDVAQITAGTVHCLAIKKDGSVWAWGGNHYWGQLGDGTAGWRPNPVPARDMTGCIAIAAGKYHSAAIKQDGSIWAWGANCHGQLGRGSEDYDPHPAPAQVQFADK